jgi:chromosome segregation ATPase
LLKFEGDLSSFKTDFDYQLTINEKVTASLESSKSQAATYFTELNSKSLELAELKIQSDASIRAHNEAQARICDLADQSDANSHTIMQLQSINDELSTQLEDTTCELSSITRNCEIFNENLTSKIIDCENFETHNHDLQTQLQKFETMNCDLRSNYESILHSSLQSNKDSDRLKQSLSDAQKQNIQYANTITNNRISHSTLNTTYHDLLSAYETLSTQKTLLAATCESLTLSLSDSKMTQISLKTTIDRLKSDIIAFKTTEIHVSNQKKKISDDYETLSSDYTQMVQFCTEKEAHLKESREKLDTALDQVCCINRVNQG